MTTAYCADALRWSRMERRLRNRAVDLDDELSRHIAYALAGVPDPNDFDDKTAIIAARIWQERIRRGI